MSRYGIVPSSFWLADPRTAGLTTLAVCIYVRAGSESICGVLQRSLHALALPHPDATAQSVAVAVAELEQRGLVRWWPELEILARADGLAAYGERDNARVAAERALADLPVPVIAYLRSPPPTPSAPPCEALPQPLGEQYMEPSTSPPPRGPDPLQQVHEQEQEHEQDQEPRTLTRSIRAARRVSRAKDPDKARAKLAALVRRHPSDRIDHAQTALDRLTQLRRELVGPRCAALTVVDDGALLLDRLAAGVTLDQLLLVIEHEADKVRRGGTADYFDAVTPFRPSNWPQRRAQAETWDARRRPPARPPTIAADRPPPASADELDELLPAWAKDPEAKPGFDDDEGP